MNAEGTPVIRSTVIKIETCGLALGAVKITASMTMTDDIVSRQVTPEYKQFSMPENVLCEHGILHHLLPSLESHLPIRMQHTLLIQSGVQNRVLLCLQDSTSPNWIHLLKRVIPRKFQVAPRWLELLKRVIPGYGRTAGASCGCPAGTLCALHESLRYQ